MHLREMEYFARTKGLTVRVWIIQVPFFLQILCY
jgi:hypothetical protein